MAILRIYPSSDRSVGDWITAPLWSKIDETVLAEADYITSSVGDGAGGPVSPGHCTFNWPQNQMNGSCVITDMIVYTQAKKAVLGTGATSTINHTVNYSGTLGASITLTTTSTLYHTHFPVNPIYPKNWTWADFECPGIYGVAAGDKTNQAVPVVYQMYIDIVYIQGQIMIY